MSSAAFRHASFFWRVRPLNFFCLPRLHPFARSIHWLAGCTSHASALASFFLRLPSCESQTFFEPFLFRYLSGHSPFSLETRWDFRLGSIRNPKSAETSLSTGLPLFSFPFFPFPFTSPFVASNLRGILSIFATSVRKNFFPFGWRFWQVSLFVFFSREAA